MKSVGSVIVSWDFSHGKDADILLVGEQTDGRVDIINAIQGPEAKALCRRLMTQKKGDEPHDPS